MTTLSISPDLPYALVLSLNILFRYAAGLPEGRLSTATTVGDEDRPILMNPPLYSVVLPIELSRGSSGSIDRSGYYVYPELLNARSVAICRVVLVSDQWSGRCD
jgi:hypothetical protein